MVEAHRGLKPGRYVALAVTDTGAGMDAETQKRIFEPFFTTKTSEKGTGLGLSIVYGIVRQSGGAIWAYSELGLGTSFKILLPHTDAEITAGQVRPAEGSAPRGTETILMAEDEEAIRRIGARILTQLGYTIISAKDGAEALAIAASHVGEIDMLLSDVVMPEMNGLELWEHLRETRPMLPALFLSGWATEAVVRHGLLDGHLPFLQKPFTSHQLSVKVREVLDARNGAAGD
jgi:CheY-like chemotaxis protein